MKSSLAAVKRQRFPARASRQVCGLFILGLGILLTLLISWHFTFSYVSLDASIIVSFWLYSVFFFLFVVAWTSKFCDNFRFVSCWCLGFVSCWWLGFVSRRWLRPPISCWWLRFVSCWWLRPPISCWWLRFDSCWWFGFFSCQWFGFVTF